jgi:hypothetical protein
MADIVEIQGDEGAARDWRRKERAAYAAFPGHWHRLRGQWGPRVQAMVRAVEGVDDAWQALTEAFDVMEQGNWRVTDAFRRIRDGERDLDALTEGIDNNSALIVAKVLEALAGDGEPPAAPVRTGRPRSEEAAGASEAHPAVRGLAPLVMGVVAVARGEVPAGLRPQVAAALDGLAAQDDWRALGHALRRVVDGDRDRAVLAAGLDDVDVQVLDLALGALSGDGAAQARLATLAQEAERAAAPTQQDQVQQLQQAFQAWLATPAGQQAMQDVDAQGLDQAAAMQALLARFLEEA